MAMIAQFAYFVLIVSLLILNLLQAFIADLCKRSTRLRYKRSIVLGVDSCVANLADEKLLSVRECLTQFLSLDYFHLF